MIRHTLRTLRRAPGRLVVTTFALALAVAAIGVFAIPTVAASSLREATERDGVVNIVIGTTDTGTADVERIVGAIDNVDTVEAQTVTTVSTIGRTSMPSLTLVGMRLGDQELNVVRAETGRLPRGPNEILLPDTSTPIGTQVTVETIGGDLTTLEVVGTGGTSFFDGELVAFTTLDTATDVSGLDGVNRLVVRTDDAGAAALRSTADDIRTALAAVDITLEYLPITIADGIHPIEAEIEQISRLIGMLGIVAGIVGLVLLASTTNTLIVERTREVAVMRALGATPRMMRRRLRRLALGIAAAAVVIGLPLGVVLSNVIARMVLQEFVGLTPDVAVSLPIMIGSAVFALVGARLVAARSARRVTKLPLAEALRDRSGRPFGRRRLERLSARWRGGSLLGRTAMRSTTHQWARSLAITAQVGAAVAALLVVSSMATTINDFNDAEVEPWRWSSTTWVAGSGLDIDADVVADDARSEAGIEVVGESQDWQVDVFGFEPATRMIDTTVVDGAWFSDPGDVVVSHGFADHVGLDVGDDVEILLASGPQQFHVVGLHANRGREFYLDRTELATALGDPNGANQILSLDDRPHVDLDGVAFTVGLDDISSDDSGRTAILLIFGAIGVVVVAVAALAVASGIAVSIYERRHEIAAIQAIGGRRRHVVRLVAGEVVALGAVGLAIGIVGGYVGGRAIARSFELSNAVEIGFVFSTSAIPVVAAAVVIGLTAVSATMVRPATRRPIAETLRGAA